MAREYDASTTANVISTAGDATLSVARPATPATTGASSTARSALPAAAARGRDEPGRAPARALAPVGGSANPTSLLTYARPVSNDPVTVAFKQAIGANDALRTGTYSKTLTFTLSTTNP